jgi:hypothetical protein
VSEEEHLSVPGDTKTDVPPADEPKSAPLTSEESTSRKAFITTLISIVMSPISVALGFYLNQSLQKPQLRIEGSSQEYSLESHVIPASVTQSIRALPTLSTNLRDVITRLELAQGEIRCVDWLDGKPWKDSCFETVMSAAHGLSDSLSEATRINLPDDDLGVRTETDLAASGAALTSLIRWLASASSDDEAIRTGDVCLHVDLFNSGYSDGVVLREGRLRFDRGEFAIDAETHTVVKAHGYEETEFCTGSVVDSEEAALAAWSTSVRGHEETAYELVVSISDGSKQSTHGHLWK